MKSKIYWEKQKEKSGQSKEGKNKNLTSISLTQALATFLFLTV